MEKDENREKYESDEVVAFYEAQSELQPAEVYLFARHLKPGMAILDIGVGGGRTTNKLVAIASRYVGADYAQAMVQASQRRFPNVDFVKCDATEMAPFADAEFDAVVFSFNGVDAIRTDEGRTRCFAEIARILKPGGVFIFSSHNARALAVWPSLTRAKPHQVVWRIMRAVGKSANLTSRALASGVYARGKGYFRDPVHGGMQHYASTPQTMAPQLAHAGLKIIERVAGPLPSIRSVAFTPWHYYACRKEGAE